MTDTLLLRNAIRTSGLRVGHIATQLGLSRHGLSLKIDGVTEFKASEIAALTQILGLNNSDRDAIFFSSSVN